MVLNDKEMAKDILEHSRNKMNKKFFCVNCGHHIYKSEYPEKCPDCFDTGSLVEVKG